MHFFLTTGHHNQEVWLESKIQYAPHRTEHSPSLSELLFLKPVCQLLVPLTTKLLQLKILIKFCFAFPPSSQQPLPTDIQKQYEKSNGPRRDDDGQIWLDENRQQLYMTIGI